MKQFFILLIATAVIGLIFSHVSVSEVDMILDTMKDKPKKDLFKVYHFLFNKEYELDSEEGLKRYRIFKSNLAGIKLRNAELGKEVFGITKFTDLTQEEFKKQYLIDRAFLEEGRGESDKVSISDKPNIVKDQFDRVDEEDGDVFPRKLNQLPQVSYIRNLGPVKDQSSCGSCWAFASMGAVESNYNLKFNQNITLSEQYLVDCDEKDGGCNGGLYEKTFPWLRLNGVVNSEEHPYKGKISGFCKRSDFNRRNLVKNFKQCGRLVKDDKDNFQPCKRQEWADLLAQGPIAVALDARDLANYKPKNGEAWVPSKCGESNHAVLAYGVVNEGGEDYLLVRNSWGKLWGINGDFKVSVKKHCNLLNEAFLPEVQIDGQAFPSADEVYPCDKISDNCSKNRTKSVSMCETGIINFNQTLGNFAEEIELNVIYSYYQGKPSYRPAYFFNDIDCKGKLEYAFDSQCFSPHQWQQQKKLLSAAPANFGINGCITLYEDPCYSGKRIDICDKIKDLSSLGQIFKPRSIIFGFTVLGVIVFEKTDFKGEVKHYINLNGLRSPNTENLEFPNLNSGKSLLIFKESKQ